MEMTSNNYEVVFRSKDENALIRVVRGKFANFVYEYGQVSIDDESEEDIKVSFTYELKEAPATYKYEDEAAEKAEFEQVIGNTLYDIVVNTDKVKEVDGTDNTKQSD